MSNEQRAMRNERSEQQEKNFVHHISEKREQKGGRNSNVWRFKDAKNETG